MGNSVGKKNKAGCSPLKKHKKSSHLLSLTSSSLNNVVVKFAKEIEEDLERRRMESFKVLAAGSKNTSTRTSAVSDPAHEMHEKVKHLNVPAVMVPKPWSEVDQILSKLKPSANDPLTQRASPLPKPAKPQHLETLAQLPETIDMWELMDDLEDTEDDSPRKILNLDSPGSLKPEDFTPRKIRTLDSSLSFTTIHTVKEVEGGAAKPETVTSILKATYHGSPRGVGRTSSGIVTKRKVIQNVNPKLLSRMEAFT